MKSCEFERLGIKCSAVSRDFCWERQYRLEHESPSRFSPDKDGLQKAIGMAESHLLNMKSERDQGETCLDYEEVRSILLEIATKYQRRLNDDFLKFARSRPEVFDPTEVEQMAKTLEDDPWIHDREMKDLGAGERS